MGLRFRDGSSFSWGVFVFVMGLRFRFVGGLRSSFSGSSFLTRELLIRCGEWHSLARSLARLVDSCKLFFDFRLLSAFDSFWRAVNKRNGDLCC